MYDELIKALHEGAEFLECSTPGIKNSFAKMCHNAADAIEELSMKLHGDEAAIAGMKREIERMVVSGNMPRWIPATERLPDAGERVLCYCRANIYEVMKMRTDGAWVHNDRVYDSAYMSGFVTHWMPLPEPPKEEGA